MSGKVVVVTGGGAGIGAEIAKAFVRSGSKAVAILGRRETILSAAKKDLEQMGSSKILTYVADIVDESALNIAFAAIEKVVGKVDVVVVNASYMPEIFMAATAEIGDWWKSIEINVKGTLLTFRAWMPHKSNETPAFIYVNAADAHFGAVPGLSAHSRDTGTMRKLIDPRSYQADLWCLQMATKSGFTVSKDDMSLPSGFAVCLASPAAAWTGGRLLWAHWDVEELVAMKDEIVQKNELVMTLNGWPKQVDIVVKA